MAIIQMDIYHSTKRVEELRKRVRYAMEQPPIHWRCPARIDDKYLSDPIPVRKSRAIELKLSQMPTDLWNGQLFAGSMTLENPRIHAEWGFPDYVTDKEREEASQKGGGYSALRKKMLSAPKYGNDDDQTDSVGRMPIDAFTSTVAKHVDKYSELIKFPCGVGTFSWYIGIGEGLSASPDGRLSGEPVSSNFSPALGRDLDGIPGAILSYAKMHESNLPAGSPLDLRLAKKLIHGEDGTQRMMALIRSFVDTGGNMMTLTVADTEELKSAQREPEKYKSLRVRMGGWCAYFTMLSNEQQEHHIRR